MTDSAKLSAFSESRAPDLVSRVRALQPNVGARTREALVEALQAPLPPAADVACPARLGEEVEHVGSAEQADHLAAVDHRDSPDAFAHQQLRGLFDTHLLCYGDDVAAHDVARDRPFLGENVRLGHDADDRPVARDDRRTGDVLLRKDLRDLLDRRVFAEGDDISSHHLLDWDHECSSSLATVPKLALPPLSSRPVGPPGSLPARCAAS